jgi:hypothetical protein
LGLESRHTKPKIPGTVPTDRHTTIPNDYGPISACFDDDPNLVNCEIDQPKRGGARLPSHDSDSVNGSNDVDKDTMEAAMSTTTMTVQSAP